MLNIWLHTSYIRHICRECLCHTAANSKRFSPIVFICRVPAALCHVLCLFHPLPRLCSIVAFFFYTCAILPEHFCFGIAFCATFSKQLTRFCVCFDITIAAIILFSTHEKKDDFHCNFKHQLECSRPQCNTTPVLPYAIKRNFTPPRTHTLLTYDDTLHFHLFFPLPLNFNCRT